MPLGWPTPDLWDKRMMMESDVELRHHNIQVQLES